MLFLVISIVIDSDRLKLSDVADRQFFFQCARDKPAKQAGPLLLFLSSLENIHVPADDGMRTVTGTRTTL